MNFAVLTSCEAFGMEAAERVKRKSPHTSTLKHNVVLAMPNPHELFTRGAVATTVRMSRGLLGSEPVSGRRLLYKLACEGATPRECKWIEALKLPARRPRRATAPMTKGRTIHCKREARIFKIYLKGQVLIGF